MDEFTIKVTNLYPESNAKVLKRYFATVQGPGIPEGGMAAYGRHPWDAISNAAIYAANHEFDAWKRARRDAS